MAKHTRLTSSCGSTRPVKKSRRSLTTKLAKELFSPQCVSEVEITVPAMVSLEVASDVVVPVTTTPEVIPNVAVPAEVILEIVSAPLPTISEPDVVSITSLGTDTIPSPPVMILGMTTLPCSSTTGLVYSLKFSPQYFIFLPLSTFIFL